MPPTAPAAASNAAGVNAYAVPGGSGTAQPQPAQPDVPVQTIPPAQMVPPAQTIQPTQPVPIAPGAQQ